MYSTCQVYTKAVKEEFVHVLKVWKFHPWVKWQKKHNKSVIESSKSPPALGVEDSSTILAQETLYRGSQLRNLTLRSKGGILGDFLISNCIPLTFTESDYKQTKRQRYHHYKMLVTLKAKEVTKRQLKSRCTTYSLGKFTGLWSCHPSQEKQTRPLWSPPPLFPGGRQLPTGRKSWSRVNFPKCLSYSSILSVNK